MSEPWIRRILYFIGAWNIIGGATALADPARHFTQLYTGALSLDDPIQLFFFRAVMINVIAWGIGYILAGLFRPAGAAVLAAGAIGKTTYALACLALYNSSRGTPMLLTVAILDVLFAAFFIYAIKRRS